MSIVKAQFVVKIILAPLNFPLYLLKKSIGRIHFGIIIRNKL